VETIINVLVRKGVSPAVVEPPRDFLCLMDVTVRTTPGQTKGPTLQAMVSPGIINGSSELHRKGSIGRGEMLRQERTYEKA
jgi:hypothetical protein